MKKKYRRPNRKEEWAEEKRKEFVETVLNNAKANAEAANDRLDTEATHEEKLPEKKGVFGKNRFKSGYIYQPEYI